MAKALDGRNDPFYRSGMPKGSSKKATFSNYGVSIREVIWAISFSSRKKEERRTPES